MNLVQDKVNEARDFFGIKDYPGNFFDFVTGNKEHIESFGLIFKQDLKQKTSGFIGYFNGTKPIICINYRKPIGHQNFTFAHEVGHFFLHRGQIIEDPNKNMARFAENLDSKDDIEIQANQFAAEILFPARHAIHHGRLLQERKMFYTEKSFELADYINDLCIKYCISFRFALLRIMFAIKYNGHIGNKVAATMKQVGPISKRYNSHLHVYVEGHPYYQEYLYPIQVLEKKVSYLIEQQEISVDTGMAIINRSKLLGD